MATVHAGLTKTPIETYVCIGSLQNAALYHFTWSVSCFVLPYEYYNLTADNLSGHNWDTYIVLSVSTDYLTQLAQMQIIGNWK